MSGLTKSVVKSLEPHLYNDKEGQDRLLFRIKFKAWGGNQDTGDLLKANFKSTLPATKATELNFSIRDGDSTYDQQDCT